MTTGAGRMEGPHIRGETGQSLACTSAPGYPISKAGQAKSIADFLSFCRSEKNIQGELYWSPEWYPEEMWKAFALFREDGNALDGLRAFSLLCDDGNAKIRHLLSRLAVAASSIR